MGKKVSTSDKLIFSLLKENGGKETNQQRSEWKGVEKSEKFRSKGRGLGGRLHHEKCVLKHFTKKRKYCSSFSRVT